MTHLEFRLTPTLDQAYWEMVDGAVAWFKSLPPSEQMAAIPVLASVLRPALDVCLRPPVD